VSFGSKTFIRFWLGAISRIMSSVGCFAGFGRAESSSRPVEAPVEARAEVRWGILGVGGISNDFCVGLVYNNSIITAVAGRDLERAEDFADKVGAARAYGTYEELAQDPEVDVVYVGTIHTMHLPHARMALEAGKHVVCEKPMGIDEAGVRALVDLAREKQLFLLEAMWTRFFPTIRRVRQVLKKGELGEPRYVQGNFGFIGPDDMTHRLWVKEQAGGCMLDIGCYLVQFATMVFGTDMPDQIGCTGRLTDQGVDSDAVISLSWKYQGSASLLATLRCNTPEDLFIYCSNGYIQICGPAHCATKAIVYSSTGRGKFKEIETVTFPLPTCPENMRVNYPNSEGFLYEVQAAEECIRDGLLESPEFTWEESLAVARIMDAFRKQVGVEYDFSSDAVADPENGVLSNTRGEQMCESAHEVSSSM